MIINHNLNAMNAQRNSSLNLKRAGKSMEMLSSGLRINNAADDAAGLAISEKMRGQIRGLNQAARNAQDGISLIQTAEGALSETHSLIQRMRELAVQAGNDTNTESDKNEIQKEINQLTSEVNKIGNTTEFNNTKLLCSGVSSEVRNNILNGLKTGWLEKSAGLINTAYGLTGTGTKQLEIFLDSGSPYGELAHVGGTSTKLELHIDVTDFEKGDGESGNNIHGKLYDDRIIAHEMTHAVMDDALGVDKMNDLHTNNKVWFIEGTAEGIAGADERLKGVIGDGTGIVTSKVDALVNRANDLLNGAQWNGDDMDYAAGYIMVKYINKVAGKDLKAVMTSIKATGSVGLDTAIDIANLKTNFAANLKTYITDTTKVNLNWGGDETDVGSILGSDHGGTDISAENIISGTTALKEQPLAGQFNVIWPSENSSASEIGLQIGANEGQGLSIKLKDMRAASLRISGQADGSVTSKTGGVNAKYTKALNNGVTNGTDNNVAEYALDVSTSSNATAAIKIFDEAIQSVSSFRSELGAYQNRLEHTAANLDNTSENLQASESRIRDVDMAKEMMNFSKNNILGQAAQAMLAQAKSQPEGILQLLR